MIRKINLCSAGTSLRAPFRQWYEKTGRSQILADPPPPYDPPVAHHLKLNERAFREYSSQKITTKMFELDLLLKFRDAFIGRIKLPMTDFVRLANDTVKILADRSEVDAHKGFRWSSRDLGRSSQLPDPDFTLLELLEADARLLEHEHLLQLGASQNERQKFLPLGEPLRSRNDRRMWGGACCHLMTLP